MVFRELFTRLCTGALSSTLVFCINAPAGAAIEKRTVTPDALYGQQTEGFSTTNTVRKIKNKVQTGIEVSYRNSTKERYSHIDPMFVSVYPIYTIEYDDGEVLLDQVDEKERISQDDLDIDYGIIFSRGENTFSAKQLSTGFEDTFTVLGAEIVKKELNSISAEYKGDGNLKTGGKVPAYDIDVVPEYIVTYDNGEKAYENDYSISFRDYSYSPKVLEKSGENKITIEYSAGEEGSSEYKSVKTELLLYAKGEGNTSSDEKKKRRW